MPSSTPGANGSQLIRFPPRRAEYALTLAEIWDGIAAAEGAGVPLEALVGALPNPRDRETTIIMLAIMGRRS